MSDPVIERLASLPGADPDAERSARTLARCATRLSSRRPSRPVTSPRPQGRLWAPALAVVGVIYIVEAFVQAFRVYAAG